MGEFYASTFTQGEKPEWVVDVENWGKSLIKAGFRDKGITCGGKEQSFVVNISSQRAKAYHR